jgi:putative glutamine amidotransferase
MSAPLIGFTLDYETKPTYSKLPWYAIRENYFSSVIPHGALPLGLPYAMERVEDYLKLIDALVIIGGDFDIPPEMYGESTVHEKVTTKSNRTQFEWALTRGAIERNMPVLGICGGEQLLNVVLGGTLIQHIPDAIPNALQHEQPNPRTEVGHTVAIAPQTLLHRITGKDEIGVNSAHHQAVAMPAPGCIVNAVATDGVIEGIEHPGYDFCLGVQWHPEYHVTPADTAIFAAFVQAAKAYQAKK